MNQFSFNWLDTKRDVVIFVPNFGRKHLLIPTLERFKTNIPNDKWIFLVVNDGRHEDLSDLEKYNLKWFTFEREPANERNGCMIRNLIIKNCQSKWLCTKDPEIIINDDIISKVIDLDDVVYRPGGMIELCDQETHKIIEDPMINLNNLSVLRQWQVTPNNYQAFHNCVTIRTQRLKDMCGYDESYTNGYGFEDVDMLMRLKTSKIPIIIDKEIITYHIAHPIIRSFHKTINYNNIIYNNAMKDLQIIANQNREWGKGI